MLKILDNILHDEEISYYIDLIKSTSNFEKPTNKDGYRNWYLRYLLNDTESKNIKNLIQERGYINDIFKFESAWINVIDNTTNQNDSYHKDRSDRTIIIYLNENFEGGSFEYYENKEMFDISPKEGLSILMDNELMHRVTPVLNGTRYSLVIFIKKEKTLL